jgi:hypothetical protein
VFSATERNEANRGHFEMFGEIDGVRSNLLRVTSVANGN